MKLRPRLTLTLRHQLMSELTKRIGWTAVHLALMAAFYGAAIWSVSLAVSSPDSFARLWYLLVTVFWLIVALGACARAASNWFE